MKHRAALLRLLCVLFLPWLATGCHGGAHRTTTDPAIPLTGTLWRLVAIDGNPISPPVDGRREPALQLLSTDSRVQGYTGCNNLAGSFTLDARQRLSFNQLITTKMACMEPTPEAEFLQALEQVDHYTLTGSTLHLHKGQLAPLLTFEVGESH
jgi:heat shock protein HslJ